MNLKKKKRQMSYATWRWTAAVMDKENTADQELNLTWYLGMSLNSKTTKNVSLCVCVVHKALNVVELF